MVTRIRLPRIHWNPFKNERDELLERFNEAVKSNNIEEAQRYYIEMRERGYTA